MSVYTQKSLKLLRDTGYKNWIVEKWNSFTKQRIDVFGFGDILSIHVDRKEIALVQTFSSAMSEHKKKLEEEEKIKNYAIDWLKANGKIYLIGWRKLKVKRGGKATRWVPRIEECLYKGNNLVWLKKEEL